MKNLVLSALVAAVASQAAGCIIIADDNTDPVPTGNRIAATWNYKVVGVTQASCPAGADGVRLIVQSLTTQAKDVVLFKCTDKILIDYFPDDNYRIWVELTLNNQPYAQSLAVEQQLVGQGTDLTFDIHEDRGYFLGSWSLKGKTTNAQLTCAQVPLLANVALDSLKQGTTNNFVNTLLPCGPYSGFSKATEAGRHTVTFAGVDSGGAALSDSVNLASQEILDRNRATTLGSVILPMIGK